MSRQPTGAYNNPPQWEREVGGAWTDVPGATASTLTVPNATEAAQGLYRLRFTNARVPNLTLYLRAAYADIVPYLSQLENRPVDVGPQSLATNFAPVSRGAATDSVNYVRTFSARAAYTNPARLVQAIVDSVQVSTQYLDGLGRPVQTVARQESPLKNDLVQPMAYDALGRQPRQYLPYVATNPTGTAGDYRPDAVYEQYGFYQRTTPPGGGAGPLAPTDSVRNVVRTGVPFGKTEFEASPLNRVLAQAAAGESWQLATGRVVSRLERPNTAADSIQYFVPFYGTNSADLTPQAGGYAAGELWGTQTTDEQVGPDGTGYRTTEWKDKLGQTVLKQVEAKRVGTGTAARSRWLRTYYVSDDFGHLRAVLPPEAVKAMQANAWAVNAAAEKFLYRYRYDGRGRVVAKQVPGTDGETWVVYNQLDQAVLTQDAAQRGRTEWSFVKYDALGRPVLTGLLTRPTATQAALQMEADATAAQFEQRSDNAAGTYPQFYTTDQAYPRLGQQGFSAGQVLTATYYDDYNFDNDLVGTPDVAYDTQLDAQLTVAPVSDPRTTGQVTRTRTRVLGVAATASGAWLTATTFYDERARPVQVQRPQRTGPGHQPARFHRQGGEKRGPAPRPQPAGRRPASGRDDGLRPRRPPAHHPPAAARRGPAGADCLARLQRAGSAHAQEHRHGGAAAKRGLRLQRARLAHGPQRPRLVGAGRLVRPGPVLRARLYRRLRAVQRKYHRPEVAQQARRRGAGLRLRLRPAEPSLAGRLRGPRWHHGHRAVDG